MIMNHHFAISIGLVLFAISGCTSVQMAQKHMGAVELKGVVTDRSSVPYSGLSPAQYGSAVVAGGLLGVAVVTAIDSVSGNRGVSTVAVKVTVSLSLIIPTNVGYQAGECLKLFIDPLYRELLERQDVPSMSLPVNSTYIERIPC
jgi:hypothetical protein